MDNFGNLKVLNRNKKVLIFGLGLNQGGVGAAKFFAAKGAVVRITDLKSAKDLKPSIEELKSFPEITYSLEKHLHEDIDWADLIIKNPAVKRENEYLEYARKKNKTIETDLGIFFKVVDRSQIIGITGSKGKSTVAALIYEGLRQNGKDAVLVGNIGTSVLETIPLIKKNTLVVLEISSFQLEGLIPHKISPKYAVITNIHPDHLNYYSGMYEYIAAKRLITQFQTEDDFLLLNREDSILNNPKFTDGLSAQVIFYSKTDLPSDFNPVLKGNHNLSNFAAALALLQSLKIPLKDAEEAIKNFKGVEFRLQLIKTWQGIQIINDTASTNPTSGISALDAFPNSILIAGGMNKNLDYKEYAKQLATKAKTVFFLAGDVTEEIKKAVPADKIAGTYDNLEKLLTDIKTVAKTGDIILFSPAATSFNLFQNEFDRGSKFNQAVERIFK